MKIKGSIEVGRYKDSVEGEVKKINDEYEIVLEGEKFVFSVQKIEDRWIITSEDGKNYIINPTIKVENDLYLSINGEDIKFSKAEELKKEHKGVIVVTSQFSGIIRKVYVNKGDIVDEGQPILIFEAMKMMNEIKSSVKGKIVEVWVKEGESVQVGQKLVKIEPVE